MPTRNRLNIVKALLAAKMPGRAVTVHPSMEYEQHITNQWLAIWDGPLHLPTTKLVVRLATDGQVHARSHQVSLEDALAIAAAGKRDREDSVPFAVVTEWGWLLDQAITKAFGG